MALQYTYRGWTIVLLIGGWRPFPPGVNHWDESIAARGYRAGPGHETVDSVRSYIDSWIDDGTAN